MVMSIYYSNYIKIMVTYEKYLRDPRSEWTNMAYKYKIFEAVAQHLTVAQVNGRNEKKEKCLVKQGIHKL